MQGRNGASLASTRRIHKREAKKHAENVARLAAYRAAGKTGIVVELIEDIVRMGERQMSGASPPIGVLAGVWKQVCDEARVTGRE